MKHYDVFDLPNHTKPAAILLSSPGLVRWICRTVLESLALHSPKPSLWQITMFARTINFAVVIMGAKTCDVDLSYSQQTVAARVSLSLKIPLNLCDRLV